MNNEHWQLWRRPRRRLGDALLLRYAVAIALPTLAAGVIRLRPVFAETPFFLFLAAVVLSAVNGGLAPAVVTTTLSALFIRLFLVGQEGFLHYGNDLAGMERMGGFLLVSLILSSFVAALRRQADQLQDSEERYRTVAETASDAIVLIDEEGEVLYVNPVAQQLFGAGADQLLGQNLSRLLPGEGLRTQLTEMKHRLDTRKKVVATRLAGVQQTGAPLLVEMTLGTSIHRGKGAFTAVIRDIAGQRLEP